MGYTTHVDTGNHENVTWARSTSMARTWTWTRPSTGMPIMQLSVPRHQAFHANDTDTCIPNYKGIQGIAVDATYDNRHRPARCVCVPPSGNNRVLCEGPGPLRFPGLAQRGVV